MDLNLFFKIASGKSKFPNEEIQIEKINQSYQALEEYLRSTKPGSGLLYGVDTCFGPHAYQSNIDRIELQKSLLYHLTVIPKNSEFLNDIETSCVLLARILVLCQGYSGVSYKLIQKLIHLLETKNLPKIPARGSLGASGDLIPLAAIGLHLEKQGWNWKPKEAIAITNGTSFITGLIAYQTYYLLRLLMILEELLKVELLLVPVFPDAFHVELGELTKNLEMENFLKRIKPYLQPKHKVAGKPIQDIYILRAIPMVWGTIWEKVIKLKKEIERELYSISDNPIYSFQEKKFIETALFYAATPSLLADEYHLLVGNIANWVERTIQFFLDPKENQNLFPLLLSPKPGVYAGLSGVGLYATHLVAEIRRDSQPGSLQSLPGNGSNQNLVPMGSLSVLRNRKCLRDLESLVSLYFLVLLQSYYLRENPPNFEHLPKIFQKAIKEWNPITKDRPLDDDLEKIQKQIKIFVELEI